MAAPRRGADDEHQAAALSLRGWALEAEAAAGIAKSLAPTAFVPDHLRVFTNPQERNPDRRVLDMDRTVQQVAAVLLAGQELEFKPMASLRAFVIIRGTVSLYAIAARALLQRRGHEIVVVESTSTRAVVRGRRADSDQWQEVIWDLDRARTAGLYPGHTDGNWRKQPKAMLVARATAEVSRWIASDALLALPQIAEEVADAEFELAPPIDEDAAEANGKGTAKAKGKAVQRSRQPRATTLPAIMPPPPEQPAPAPPPEDADPPPGEKPSKAQLAKLHAGLKDIGITGREEGLALIAAWAGRPVSSTGKLRTAELEVVLERLDDLRRLREQEPDHDAGQDAAAAEQRQADDDAPPPEGPSDAEPD